MRFVSTAGLFALVALAGLSSGAADEMVKHAIEQSQFTSPGSHPFHLRAKVVEATNVENDGYKAEIEEYWQSPDKWRRTVKTSNLSQILIVNGGRVYEKIDGDYYPHWLQTIVSAIFNSTAPMEGIELSESSDNPVIGTTQICRRFTRVAGIPPVTNNVFSVFCLKGGLIDFVLTPGYDAQYKDYKKFSSKQVARKIREYLEPGTELEASIDELSDLDTPDEALWAIEQPNAQVQTITVNEKTFRELAVSMPAIQWPTIRDGKPTGVLSIYVCVDRSGHVRETYGLNSDNPYMTDAARKQVMNWQFKPAASKGTPVQVESILTFAYATKIGTH